MDCRPFQSLCLFCVLFGLWDFPLYSKQDTRRRNKKGMIILMAVMSEMQTVDMAAVVMVAVVVVDTNWERNFEQLLDDYQFLMIF